MVLRLALYLVEAGFYDSVEIAFFIVGHTKNPCDRCFNTLKTRYRGSNVFTMKQLQTVLDVEPGVTVVRLEDHCDWDSLLDVLYSKMPAGTVKMNHNFTVRSNSSTSMTIQRTTLDTDQKYTKTFDLKKGTLPADQRRTILKATPALLPRPGLKTIKQVELVSKWRQFIPPEYRADILPDLSSEKVKEYNKERYKNKRKIVIETVESKQEKDNVRELKRQREHRERIEQVIAMEEEKMEEEARQEDERDATNLQDLEE